MGGDALLVAVLVVLLGVDLEALTTIVAPALGWPERLNTSIGYLVASVWVTEGIAPGVGPLPPHGPLVPARHPGQPLSAAGIQKAATGADQR